MSSSDLATQKALFDACAAAWPSAAVEDVARQNPDAGAFPLILIGESTSTPWDTKTEDGEAHTFTLHVFSRYPGKKECRLIMAALRLALHEVTLPIAGFTCVSCRVVSKEIITDPDLVTSHGYMRVRVLVDH